MADVQLTDDLGKSVQDVKIDLSQPSSLLRYAKSELLHLAVAPDFIARAPQRLAVAAPSPIDFQLKLQHEFQLGGTKPEISLTPALQATIRANTTKGDKKEDFLFVSRTGRPWRESKVVEKRLNPLLRKLSIEQRELKGIRHFNATEMDSKNVPVKTRQTRLGHDDPE